MPSCERCGNRVNSPGICFRCAIPSLRSPPTACLHIEKRQSVSPKPQRPGPNNFTYASIFRHATNGDVKDSDVAWHQDRLPILDRGQILVENVYVSVDPYQRITLTGNAIEGPAKIGSKVGAYVAGYVIASEDPRIPVRARVAGLGNWESHSVLDGSQATVLTPSQSFEDAMTLFNPIIGLTAWVAVEACNVRAPVGTGRHAVAISAAAGAVGHLCVQLAKARGAFVIGIAGGPEKCEALLRMGADAAVDYKAQRTPADFKDAMRRASAPCGGIDSYIDMVGGGVSVAVLENMKQHGRIALVGAISQYQSGGSGNTVAPGHISFPAWDTILFKELTVIGVLCFSHLDKAARAFEELQGLRDAGHIRVGQLDVGEGLESITKQMRKLFTGQNIGKTVVRV